MRLFTLIGVIIWNSQHTQTTKSCSRTNTLVQVWIEHTFNFVWLPQGWIGATETWICNHFRISHIMFHTLLVGVIVWKSQRMQTPKARTLVFLTPCFTLKLRSPCDDAIVHNHPEWSFETLNAYKLPTSCSYAYPGAVLCVCVCVTRKHTFFCNRITWNFDMKKKTKRFSHAMYCTPWSDHLEISTHTNSQNSHSCIEIQTPKTRTLVHTLPEYKFTLPTMKLFSCPKSKEFTLAWTATITNLQKQSEVSRDKIFSFLRVSVWCPPVYHYRNS